METLISSLSQQLVFAITHASDVAAARRGGQKVADALGFDETRSGQLAIVITEAATNILKHAGHGMLFVSKAQSGALPGVDVLAIDAGPGITDLTVSLRDGVSSAGTSGTGLGAMRRLSDVFDVYSSSGKGVVLFMRLWHSRSMAAEAGAAACGVEVAALCLPLAGEDVCGDGWAVACDSGGAGLLAADGLGHGPEAALAAEGAIGALVNKPDTAPGELLDSAHAALRVTRGAAMAAARIDFGADQMRFAGIGNIGACVYDHDGSRRQMVSHNGIVGHNMRKVQEFTVPCPPGSLCIMHSDGIQTQWSLEQYPGLQGRSPALVAGVLMRDFARKRDDAMVLVVRRRGQLA